MNTLKVFNYSSSCELPIVSSKRKPQISWWEKTIFYRYRLHVYNIFFLTYALNCKFNCVTLVDIDDRWRLPKVKKRSWNKKPLANIAYLNKMLFDYILLLTSTYIYYFNTCKIHCHNLMHSNFTNKSYIYISKTWNLNHFPSSFIQVLLGNFSTKFRHIYT